MQEKLRQGEAFFAQGKTTEAEKCFTDLLAFDPTNSEVYNNLGVIAFQRRDINQALEYFTHALQIDPCHRRTLLNYSALLKDLDLLHEIRPLLEKAVEKFPNDPELSGLLHGIQLHPGPKAKVTVACLPGMHSFIQDIVDFLKTKYEVQTCFSDSKKEIESSIQWADVVWFEWANELAVEFTNHSNCLDGKRVICRLHSYEAFNHYAGQICWEKISDLIFVAEHIKSIVLQQVPDLPQRVQRIHIVPNGVNMALFPFKRRTQGTNLAYLGNINYKKGPMLLLHAFRELVQTDRRYKLFIAGKIQNERYTHYFEQMIREMDLQDNIRMQGWVDDVTGWLEDKHYVVCTSILEGHPVGIMEAMARGLKPLIHNYVGARGSYPEQYLWNTIPEFVRMATEENYHPEEYREFIERNYSSNIQLRNIERIINSTTQ